MSATVNDAEREALELLRSSWADGAAHIRLPVDPVELAEALGIVVRYTWLPPDQSGQIVIHARQAPVITLNEADHRHRQRFTCAHELGHYIQRRADPRRGNAKFVDYRSTLAGLGIDSDEIYANQFAAALLMPAHLVKFGYQVARQDEYALARQFDTSVQALRLRLRNLGLTG